MTVAARLTLAAALALTTTAAAYGFTGDAPQLPVLGPEPVTVVIEAKHSTFSPAHLRVAQGTPVRFVLVNRDPIHHELIVGPPEVHDEHRDGTEHLHPPVPGEVSVGPLERAVTTFTFDDAGTVEMACHLPGHHAYGMRGEVEVVPAS